MFSTYARRDRALLLGVIAISLIAVTILASGLSAVEIQSSRQLTADTLHQVAEITQIPISDSARSALSFLAGAFRVFLLVSLPFSIYYFVKSSRARKRVLVQLAYLLGFSFLILSLSRSLGRELASSSSVLPPIDSAPAPTTEFIATPAEVPEWMFIAAAMGITFLLGAAVTQVYRRYKRSSSGAITATTEAERALKALDGGENLENVIYRAYFRLCALSSEQLGLKRSRGMTPMEYESVLARSGVPTSPLARLTRLFEKARYGSAPLGDADEQEAVSALQSILEEGI